MTIHRYPNKAGLMRGPNMRVKLCSACLEDRTHGFWIFEQHVMKQSVFICDECLEAARKEERSEKAGVA